MFQSLSFPNNTSIKMNWSNIYLVKSKVLNPVGWNCLGFFMKCDTSPSHPIPTHGKWEYPKTSWLRCWGDGKMVAYYLIISFRSKPSPEQFTSLALHHSSFMSHLSRERLAFSPIIILLLELQSPSGWIEI